MENFHFQEACVVIPRQFHFDQMVIDGMPRKIRVRRATENDATVVEEPPEMNHEPSPKPISHRRATYSASIFMNVKNVPFSNYKRKE